MTTFVLLAGRLDVEADAIADPAASSQRHD
jgi:hypothetical protein